MAHIKQGMVTKQVAGGKYDILIPMKLTTKEEKFCNLYLTCGTHLEAYKGSYSYKNMKQASIKTEAWKILQRPRVQNRIAELQAKIEDKNILTFKEIQILLSDKVKEELNGEGLKAVDILNKMAGNYEADNKLEVKTDVRFASLDDYYSGKAID